MNHLKMLTMVSMEAKVVSEDSFLDKLSEKPYLNGCAPPPSLVFGAQKSLIGIGLTGGKSLTLK